MAEKKQDLANEEAPKKLNNSLETPKPVLKDEDSLVETKQEVLDQEPTVQVEPVDLTTYGEGLNKDQQDAQKIAIENPKDIHNIIQVPESMAPPTPTNKTPIPKPQPILSDEQKKEKLQELMKETGALPEDIKKRIFIIIDDDVKDLEKKLDMPKEEIALQAEQVIDEVLNQQDPTDKPSEVIYEEVNKALFGVNTPGETIQVGAIDTVIEQLEQKGLDSDYDEDNSYRPNRPGN